MGTGYEPTGPVVGAGDPAGQPDTGFGDAPSAPSYGPGAGDPRVPPSVSISLDGVTTANQVQVGEEGGYLIYIKGSPRFEDAPHRVDFIRESDGVLHPIDGSGAFAPTSSDHRRPSPNPLGTMLIVSTPSMEPYASYAIRVTFPSGIVVEQPGAVSVYPRPVCAHADAMRAKLDHTVFPITWGDE